MIKLALSLDGSTIPRVQCANTSIDSVTMLWHISLRFGTTILQTNFRLFSGEDVDEACEIRIQILFATTIGLTLPKLTHYYMSLCVWSTNGADTMLDLRVLLILCSLNNLWGWISCLFDSWKPNICMPQVWMVVRISK